MAGGKPIEVKPGQLMTGLSANSAGISNYIVKREWRRVLDRDVRAEGFDGFRPNQNLSRYKQSHPGSGEKVRFTNQAAYFNNACQVGYTATLVGSFQLPFWILLQTYKNRFVVPPGIFSGLSQAEADQSAQEALNEFVQANMSNGNIVCSANTTPTTIVIMKDQEVGNVLPTQLNNVRSLNGSLFAVGTNANLYQSTDGTTWTQIAVGADTTPLYDIAYGNGAYVIVAQRDGTSAGVTWTSPDLVTWTKHNWGGAFSSSNNSYTSIDFGLGLFVAVSVTGHTAYSADGITWTTAIQSTRSFNRVRFLNGGFITAIGVFEDKVYLSADGMNWTSVTPPAAVGHLVDVAFGSGVYVLTTSGAAVFTSPDAITWTVHSFTDDAQSGVAFGNGEFVTCTSINKQVYTSPDGITWTLVATANHRPVSVIYFAGGLFVVVELYT